MWDTTALMGECIW